MARNHYWGLLGYRNRKIPTAQHRTLVRRLTKLVRLHWGDFRWVSAGIATGRMVVGIRQLADSIEISKYQPVLYNFPKGRTHIMEVTQDIYVL